jgi:chromosome segregation ATPase
MTPPKPESRISSLEKRATALEATIEELSCDQAEELKAIRQEIKASYKEIGDTFVNLENNLEAVKAHLDRMEATMATKEDLGKLEARIDRIEARLDGMATKQDIAALETRLVDTHQAALATEARRREVATTTTESQWLQEKECPAENKTIDDRQTEGVLFTPKRAKKRCHPQYTGVTPFPPTKRCYQHC